MLSIPNHLYHHSWSWIQPLKTSLCVSLDLIPSSEENTKKRAGDFARYTCAVEISVSYTHLTLPRAI